MTPSNIDTAIQKRQIELLSVLMFLFMLVLAFIPGVKAVQGLQWGASVDFHRDAAFVRALLEGHYGEDPIYLGGSMWYTPLICWLEAAAVSLTGLPVDQVLVQIGAYSNLLVPVSFFIMTWYFLGPVRAVFCSAIFLFFTIGQEPGWGVPTYSPRLIPVSFCHWFFYIELILIDRAFRSTRVLPSIVAGVGAGIAFLAHAAPAIISVLIIVVFTAVDSAGALRRNDRQMAWRRMLASVVAGVAFFIATLPLTWTLLGEYGMRIVNRSGFLYTYYALTLREKEVFLFHNVALINLVALAGVWIVLRNKAGILGLRTGQARRILITWLVISILLFVYSYAVVVLDTQFGILLPGLVPTFHFFFYAKAALAVFAGIAVWQTFTWIGERVKPLPGGVELSSQRTPVVILFALLAIACSLNYPSYATRRDVFCVRNRNLAFAERTDAIGAFARIHALPWDAVILCDWELSIWPVMPAARKLVATASTMGNPYLDQRERQLDRDTLMVAMQTPRPATEELLAKYGVTHLLVRSTDLPAMPEAPRWFSQEAFRNQSYVLLAR